MVPCRLNLGLPAVVQAISSAVVGLMAGIEPDNDALADAFQFPARLFQEGLRLLGLPGLQVLLWQKHVGRMYVSNKPLTFDCFRLRC